MSHYPPADAKIQNYETKWPGALMTPNTLVIHTTEGNSWPDYLGGSEAPNATGKPDMKGQKIQWRAHFPDERSARALVNLAGGVETNALNCDQIELVGTCDPRHKDTWPGVGKVNVDYIYWPEAPAWALAEVAGYVAYMHTQHGMPFNAARFLAYPSSYGNSPVRFTARQWTSFYGICGHEHIPENDHGDPGSIDIAAIIDLAKKIVGPHPTPAPTPAPPIHTVTRLPKRLVFHVDPKQFYYLEDSGYGVKLALAKRYGWIDLDVSKLKDGTLVVAHGPRPLLHKRTGGYHDTNPDLSKRVKVLDTPFSALTWDQVRWFRSNDGKGHKIWRAVDLIPYAHRHGLKVEAEAKSNDITQADWANLRAHLTHPDWMQVKAFPQFMDSLACAHAEKFITFVLIHNQGQRRIPRQRKRDLDYFRGLQPIWI